MGNLLIMQQFFCRCLPILSSFLREYKEGRGIFRKRRRGGCKRKKRSGKAVPGIE